jgi:predicted adenylyl cyclase CyaB
VCVEDADAARDIFDEVFGVRGVVQKTRYLYHVGQTRIHVDDVACLGWFLEIEVVLRPDQAHEQGVQIANDLMKRLDIRDEDLIDRAYIDLLAGQ